MAKSNKILIVEDDANTAEMLNTYFSAQGYLVHTTSWGKDAVDISREWMPDLVIQDIHLPDIDGYQVVREMRDNTRTSRVPVIFLTRRNTRENRLAGLSLGAVDYIHKPCDLQELRLRVQNALQRASYTSLVNPITGLSDRNVVCAYLQKRLGKSNLALVHVSLGGSAAFSETYGFVARDDALRAVGAILKHVTDQLGGQDDIVGHVERSGFVIVTRNRTAARICREVAQRLSGALARFYPAQDLPAFGTPPEMQIQIGVARGAFASPEEALAAAASAQHVFVPPHERPIAMRANVAG
jgi:PleD family two-component response regulator